MYRLLNIIVLCNIGADWRNNINYNLCNLHLCVVQEARGSTLFALFCQVERKYVLIFFFWFHFCSMDDYDEPIYFRFIYNVVVARFVAQFPSCVCGMVSLRN